MARKHKHRELSRSKRKKEGHKPPVTAPAQAAVNPAPAPATLPLPPLAVSEAVTPIPRTTAPDAQTAGLMVDLKRVGLLAAVILAVLVALSFIIT